MITVGRHPDSEVGARSFFSIVLRKQNLTRKLGHGFRFGHRTRNQLCGISHRLLSFPLTKSTWVVEVHQSEKFSTLNLGFTSCLLPVSLSVFFYRRSCTNGSGHALYGKLIWNQTLSWTGPNFPNKAGRPRTHYSYPYDMSTYS